AAAVAGQAVGGHAAAMRHPRQRFQRAVHDCPRTFAIDLRDQAETATVVFACGVVETPIRALPHRRGRCRGKGGYAAWRMSRNVSLHPNRTHFVRCDNSLPQENFVAKETTYARSAVARCGPSAQALAV